MDTTKEEPTIIATGLETKAPNKALSLSHHSDEEEAVTGTYHDVDATAIPDDLVTNSLQRRANRLIKLIGAEARGIERVDESLRTQKTSLRGYWDMATIWFSVNLTVGWRNDETRQHQ